MKFAVISMVAVLVSIPSGLRIPQLSREVPAVELTFEEAAEELSDSLELLKSCELLVALDRLTGLDVQPNEAWCSAASPTSEASLPDRESHFCRPPPRGL